jgi:hypothetical protein
MSVVNPCCPCGEVPCSNAEYGLSFLVLASTVGIFIEWLWFTSPWVNWMRFPPVLQWTRFALASSLPWVFVLCRCRILRYSCGNFLNLFSGLVPICFLPARRNRIPSSFLYFHSALVGFRNFSRSLYSITLTSSNKFVSSSSFEFSAFRDVVTSVLFPFPSRLPEISVLSSFIFGDLMPCPSLSPSA